LVRDVCRTCTDYSSPSLDHGNPFHWLHSSPACQTSIQWGALLDNIWIDKSSCWDSGAVVLRRTCKCTLSSSSIKEVGTTTEFENCDHCRAKRSTTVLIIQISQTMQNMIPNNEYFHVRIRKLRWGFVLFSLLHCRLLNKALAFLLLDSWSAHGRVHCCTIKKTMELQNKKSFIRAAWRTITLSWERKECGRELR
jgi:hypothetical protein